MYILHVYPQFYPFIIINNWKFESFESRYSCSRRHIGNDDKLKRMRMAQIMVIDIYTFHDRYFCVMIDNRDHNIDVQRSIFQM